MNLLERFSTVIFLLHFMLLSSCMRIEEGRTSRLAITDVNGKEIQDLFLIPGMTYRLYAMSMVPTRDGEEIKGAATQDRFMDNILFSLDDLVSPVGIDQEGCLQVDPLAASQTAIVRLNGDSIHRGKFDALSRIHIESIPAIQVSTLIGGTILDFQVAELRSRLAPTLFGIMAETNQAKNNIIFKIVDEKNETPHPELGLLPNDKGLGVFSWSDTFRGNFNLGFGVFDATQKAFSLKESLFSMLLSGLNKNPISIITTSTDMIKLVKLYGGAIGGGDSAVLGLYSSDKSEEYKLFLLSSAQGASSGTIQDITQSSGTDQSLILHMNTSETPEDIIRFRESPLGGLTLLVRHLDKGLHKLKMITLNHVQGVTVEDISNIESDAAHTFDIDVTKGGPKIIFVKNGNLLFAKRQFDTWKIDTVPLGDADASMAPQLLGDTEDGTLAAMWGLKGEGLMRISKDQGATWSNKAIHFSLASSKEPLLHLISFPCGGTGVLTVQNEKDIMFRLMHTGSDNFFEQKILSNPNPISHLHVFKDNTSIYVFYSDNRGIHFFSIN